MPALKIPRSLVVCLGLAVLSVAGWSQTPDVATPSAPTSASPTPDEFMRQAADAMSLTAPDMKPWHMRARFKFFDTDGKVGKETLLEVWWANPEHFKLSYKTGDIGRTEYRSGNASFFTGSDKAFDFGNWLLLHPLPYRPLLERVTFVSKEVSMGGNKLRCLTETEKQGSAKLPYFSSYCFDTSLPVLRISLDSYGQRTTWNGLVRVHGHFFAKQIKVSNARQDPQFTIDVEQIDPELGVEETALAPPAGASPLKKEIGFAPGVMAGNKISGDNPSYSETAKSIRAEGTVVLHAKISKEGSIEDLQVVSGPLILQPGALKAVKTWRYQPYMLAGEPVEVETTVNVIFNLGHF